MHALQDVGIKLIQGTLKLFCLELDCPVLICNKPQTEIALSTTESEYIALSQARREVLHFINLVKEINAVFPLNLKEPKFHCKVFEDNNSCI